MKANAIEQRRELAALSSYEATKARAEEFPFLPETPSEKWVKVVWYSDKCGGKLITFKAGSPYMPKKRGKKNGETELKQCEKDKKRMANSLSRTRKRIFEIAACNSWEWFFTGTLDGTKCDREDLNATFKALSQYIRDYRKKTGNEVKYLIVPEQHKNGGWHFHGLFHGLPEEEMHKFTLSDKIPLRIKKTISAGIDVWTWTDYANKFGYSTVTRVRDENAVACYVTKYITKDMIAANDALGTKRHLYYASQGLQRPQTLAESLPNVSYTPTYDFENEYVEIRRIKTREEAEAIIKNFGLQRGENMQ